MANLNGATGVAAIFKAFLRKLETTDPKHPDTWNPNYQTLIDNDVFLKAFADEVSTARGSQPSLKDRLVAIEQTQASLSPEYIDELTAAVKYALDQAGVANRSIRALKSQLQQEGELLIENRGIVSGCTATKSTTAARNLNLAAGVCFANGRAYSVDSGNNMASVPSNISAGNASAVVYLYRSGNGWKMAVTAIGEAVPAGAIRLYNVTIPPNSTDATDPTLANVTLTSVRRVEVGFPQYLDTPVSQFVAINNLSANDFRLDFEVVSAEGAPCERKSLSVPSRATNGFTLELASAADNVLVRYRVSKLNN
ncbi:hypothetical protein [Pseudomonas vancouverensis]|uniref:Uncharacterized protein n=1 Tax=Pseudomonas vancouverensis TaxID=95300 RepID=A0A1H2N8D4_PSEVA|nr:hypothetical protein [Pseudomonas vancouverensis]KAB0494019.1 hypothetical protein F7R09_19780 [Pseudomonas vancouverensis]TDB61456.1 hypothetical protein EIY72_15430 [Pseudomonas vancouverensis]SDV01730.1 hypothetical protein SAMN05216558_1867 [Pseudomonas vancouverensis]